MCFIQVNALQERKVVYGDTLLVKINNRNNNHGYAKITT